MGGDDLTARALAFARDLLEQAHGEPVPTRVDEKPRTQMVARFELVDFTTRMNILAAMEREARGG